MGDKSMEKWKCPCDKVIRKNSARTFNNPSKIITKIYHENPLFFKKKILEIGSGCLRNSQFLLDMGCEVHVLELSETIKKYDKKYNIFKENGGIIFIDKFPEEMFELIIMTFVLETICPIVKRTNMLNSISEHLVDNGKLLLSVRGIGDVKTIKHRGIRCPPPGDGYFTPIKTFIKPYEINELKNYLNNHGFEFNKIFRGKGRKARIIEILAGKENE